MVPHTRLSPIPTQIVDAFRAVAPAIEAFAREHDLLIDRYRRGKPSWELRFARRVGGGFGVALGFARRAVARLTGLELSAPISGQRAMRPERHGEERRADAQGRTRR